MADGYIIEIPEEVLKKLNTADEKIEKLSKTSQETQKIVKQAFADMANGIDPFLKKLTAAKNGLSNLMPNKLSSSAEGLANNIATVATQLNKVSESPIETVNRKMELFNGIITNSSEKINKLNSDITGLTNKQTTEKQVQLPIPETFNEGRLKALRYEQEQLQRTSESFNKYIESLTKTSVSSEKTTEAFKSGTSEMQRQSKLADDFTKALNNVAAAGMNVVKSTQKRNEAEAKKKSNAADRQATQAEQAYNRAMMATEGTITQRINKIAKLRQAQEQLTATGRNYSVQLNRISAETQRLATANEEAEKKTKQLKSTQSSVLNTTDQLARKIALLFSVSAITGYVEKLVAVRGEFELQQRALQAILQNKDEADKLFEKTVALAIKSPFQVKELVTYTKQLAAYRIESDKLYDTTKMLADVSAGLGVDMGRLILAYGQVKAANYLRASEVRQFTEAGVNILGELADIYSELEGRMVSVGEVQSRITKRMVAFGDVEQVFKRITSAGGIFYNMQEIQAETLAGMISNLKDNFDVMFNEIGKANDGVLKGFVSAISSLVANWRYFAIALNTGVTVFALYAGKVAIASLANGAFSASTLDATIKQGGLAAAMGRTLNVLKGTALFLKNNPWIIIATAVAGAIYYIKDLNDKLEITRARYEILNSQLDTQKNNLESLTSNIEKQIIAQEKAEKALSETKEGTDEYTKAENKANEERDKTQKLLNILKTQYPEVYSKVMQNKEGIKSLANEQKKYNDELERTRVLNKLMQAEAPLIGKSFKEQSDAYKESLDEQKKASSDLETTYETLAKELNYLFKTDSKIPASLKENATLVMQGNDDIVKKTKLLISYSEAIARHTSTSNRTLNTLRKNANQSLSDLEDANDNRTDQLSKMNASYESLRESALKEAEITLSEFKKLSEAEQKSFSNRMTDFIKSAAGAESIFSRAFLKERIKQEFGITLTFDEKKVEKEMTDLQKSLAKYVSDYNKRPDVKGKTALELPVVTADTDVEEYRDKIYKAGQALIDAAKENANSVENLAPHIDKVQTEAIKLANAAGKEQQAIAKLFGYIDKKTTNKQETEYEKRLREQLALLKKLNAQYEKLRQTQGKDEATKTIKDTFGDAYMKAFNKPITTLNFDKTSIANEIDSLAKTIGKKADKALGQSFINTASELRATATVTAVVEGISDIERQFDSMFNDYELSIQLDDKGLNKDTVAALFNINTTSLDDIRKKLESVYPDPEKLGDKQLNSYFKVQKRITDADQRENKKRLEQFLDYLKNSVDAVQQVQSEGGLQISIATNLFNKGKLEADQYVQIIKNVTDKVNSEVSKINLEKFKKTPEYIQAMGDLSGYTAKELEALISKMEKFIAASAGSLNATDLKVYTDAIQKMRDQIESSKSPFKKNVFSEYKQIIKLEKQYQEELENKNRLLQKQAEQMDILMQKERDLKTLQDQDQSGASVNDPSWKDNMAAAQEDFKLANDNLNNTNNQLNISQGKLGNISGQIGKISGGLGSALGMVDKIVTGIYQSINATLDLMNQFKELAESRGIDTDKGGWREVQQAGEVLGNVNERVMSSWNNFKSGNIAGAVADAVGSITTVFTTFNKQHDARREQKIQKEIQVVQDLERTYEKLGKAIDEAYSFDTLNASNENAQRNLEQQIQSYQNMIDAERDKKDQDDDRIKEWQNTIEDLKEKQKGLNAERLEGLGGFGSAENVKSAAEDFASSWLKAYKETGDGLSALEDKWDEYIDNIVMKQLMLKATDKLLKPVFDMIDNMFPEGKTNITGEELDELRDKIDEVAPQLNEIWKQMAEAFKIPIGSDTELSGLQKGIQSVTEETAQILEALLNSLRFFVADSNLQIKNISAAFSSRDPELNPMYGELLAQTKLLRSIDDRLASVITAAGNHPMGGFAIKSLI